MVDSTTSGVFLTGHAVVLLGWNRGLLWVAAAVGYIGVVHVLREWLSPALAQGKLAGEVSEVTGRYFGANQRLVQHSEAIAAADGGPAEKAAIECQFTALAMPWQCGWNADGVRTKSSTKIFYQHSNGRCFLVQVEPSQ